jgi:membrane protein YqaA with SNARE-associated domain
MNWKIAILLFCLNIFDDILCVFFTRRTVAGKALQAAVLSGVLTFVVSISVVSYVENRWYLIPIIIGSSIGTFVAIKLDKHLKKKKRAKKIKKKEAKNERVQHPISEILS